MNKRTSANLCKCVVLGMDGATLDLIVPWVEEGKLPHFKRMMDEGAYGTLMSTAFPGSAPAWSSFLTGKNPGKHGIFFFTEHAAGSYQVRLVNAAMRTGEPFWDYLSRRGRRMGVMNVPMTFPPSPVNGFFVSGMDAPGVESTFTHPSSLKQRILEIYPDYKIEVGVWGMISGGRQQQAVEALKEIIKARGKIARRLLRENECDVGVLVYTATDRVQHFFWKYLDKTHPQYDEKEARKYGSAILEVYQTLDAELEKWFHVMDDDANLIIVSDHGAGPNSNRSIYLNRWLEKEGYLYYRSQKKSGAKSLKTRIKVNTVGLMKRLSRQYLPRSVKEGVLRILPNLINWSISTMRLADIDWSRTRAYSEESVPWIWINLKGREPGGIVQPGAEYWQLCSDITRSIQKITDPETGETIVEKVMGREALFTGPHVGKAPDLSVFFKNDTYISRPTHYSRDHREFIRILSKKELDLLEKDAKSSASHRHNGILFMWGPMIRCAGYIPTTHIIDVAPTLLYLLDESIPDDYDGRVIADAIKEDLLQQRAIRRHPADEASQSARGAYDSVDEEKMEKRLRDLGYLPEK